MLSFGVNRVITLLTTVVLARLLVPADFGVLALALLFVAVFTLVGELGLGSAMILHHGLDARGRGTVLTMMLASSAVLALVMIAISPVVAEIFDEPRVTGPLRALSGSIALFGFNWFYETSLQRELEFRSRFTAQATQTVVYASVAIVSAAFGAGIWALVAGQLAGAAAWSAALLSVAPERVRPTFDRELAGDMLRRGRGFIAQGGLAFLKQNADYLAVGRVLGSGSLGLYSMAYRLAELPYAAIADPVAKVTFPGFAQMRARGEDVGTPFLSALQLVALVTTPMGVLLSATAEPFTRAVLGDRWLGMIGALTALGLWGAVRPIQSTTGWLLNSMGLPGLLARVSATTLCLMVPGLFIAASIGGITAVAWVMLAEMTVAACALAWFASRRADVPLPAQWIALRPVIVAAPPAWLAARLTAEAQSVAPALVLALALASGIAVYGLVLHLGSPGLLASTLRQVRRTIARTPTSIADPEASMPTRDSP